MDNFFAGEYGRSLPAASFKLIREGEIVSAALVTLLRDAPFLAVVMTHPGYKRQGIARKLLLRSCGALSGQGHVGLTLAVTNDNSPARRLYQRLGFVTLPATSSMKGTHT
jgi:ribosomal protein S18 acetylase RimI-like enzyme